MMGVAPILLLDQKQVERLLMYMQTYRGMALIRLAPTQERNTILRLIQRLQGKLLTRCQQESTSLPLLVSLEERASLQTMVKSLLGWYGEQPASPERTSLVVDLGKWYLHLKQMQER